MAMAKLAHAEYSKNFEFKWVIENFSMIKSEHKGYQVSPEFVLYTLPDVKWFLEVDARAYKDTEILNFCLDRNIKFLNCKVECKMRLENCTGRTILDDEFKEIVFDKQRYCLKWRVPNIRHDTLINDILIVYCFLQTAYDRNVIYDEALRRDLERLQEQGLFADTILYAPDKTFNVHRPIVNVRWRALADKLDSDCHLDVSPDVLKAMIKYVYTGKIDYRNSELAAEVCEAAVQYELTNMTCKTCSPVTKWTALTHIKAHRVFFDWFIPSFSSLPLKSALHSYLFPANLPDPCGFKLILYLLEEKDKFRNFKIELSKLFDVESKPIFARCAVSIYPDDKPFEKEYVFQSNENWICSDLTSANSDLKLQFTFIFKRLDDNEETIIETHCEPTSPSVQYCEYYKKNLRSLLETGELSDVKITAGSKTFDVHKAILSARSPVFFGMFQNRAAESEDILISDMEPAVVEAMLVYIYTAEFETKQIAQNLRKAAIKYAISKLKEKCNDLMKTKPKSSVRC